MQQLKLFLLLLLLSNFAYAQNTQKVPYGKNPDKGQYFHVNNIDLYYEIYGSGQPLLLLHGSGGSIGGHAQRIEHFKDNYKVIAVDSRAHGKSSDTPDSLTYEVMADDIAKLLEHLKVDSTLVWGQSDGGIIGLMLAMEHPELVKRVAVFGANTRPDTTAVVKEIVEDVVHTLQTTNNARLKKQYRLLRYQPNIPSEELKKIKAPVLLMYGDRDVIKLEHALELFYQIPRSNLFVMPGATHFGAYQKPELFNKVLDDFFQKPFSNQSTVDMLKKNN